MGDISIVLRELGRIPVVRRAAQNERRLVSLLSPFSLLFSISLASFVPAVVGARTCAPLLLRGGKPRRGMRDNISAPVCFVFLNPRARPLLREWSWKILCIPRPFRHCGVSRSWLSFRL